MFKKNIKPILMAGALALATAVSPVLALEYQNPNGDKATTIANGDEFSFTKNYTFADWYDVTKIPYEFSYSISANDDNISPLFTMDKITFNGSENNIDTSDTNATTTLSKTGKARVDITKNQLEQTANIIPGEYKYTIKETPINESGLTCDSTEYLATVYVQNIKDKNTEGKELETTHVGVAAITLQEITGEGESKIPGQKLESLTFNNSFLETEEDALSVEKVVTGNYGDKTKYFHFKGEVTIPSTSGQIMVQGVTQKNNTGGYITNGNIILEPGQKVSFDFYLKSGDALEFEKLPVGTKYSFKEVEAGQDGYKTTISGADSLSGNEQTIESSDDNIAVTGTVTKETNDADAVVFTNKKTGSPVTGVIVNNMPYIALLGASGAGLVVLAASKKRSKK